MHRYITQFLTILLGGEVAEISFQTCIGAVHTVLDFFLGGEVAEISNLVEKAFKAERDLLSIAAKSKKPGDKVKKTSQ